MPQQDEADIQQPPAGDDPQSELAATEIPQPDEVEPEVPSPTGEAEPDEFLSDDTEPEDERPQPVAQLTRGEAEAASPLLISAHAGESDEPGEPEAEAAAEPVAEPAEPVKEPRRLSRAERDTFDRQQRRFAACGRCGYFIADCRIKLGEEAFRDAILESRDGWVRLEGDTTIHKMVMDAYGVELDAHFDLFDGTCPECRRRFVVVNPEAGATRLKIRV